MKFTDLPDLEMVPSTKRAAPSGTREARAKQSYAEMVPKTVMYDICIRTDKHGQAIYGPSVAPLESTATRNRQKVSIVALGATQAMHEFLVLHYLATDSAQGWDDFFAQCLPRRATAMNLFDTSHVRPSHTRFAHHSWTASMNLLLDLLMRTGKLRPSRKTRRCFLRKCIYTVCMMELHYA